MKNKYQKYSQISTIIVNEHQCFNITAQTWEIRAPIYRYDKIYNTIIIKY